RPIRRDLLLFLLLGRPTTRGCHRPRRPIYVGSAPRRVHRPLWTRRLDNQLHILSRQPTCRPMHLAGRRRPHPAPPRPAPRPRPTPPLGETRLTRTAHPRPRPTRIPERPRDHAPARQST